MTDLDNLIRAADPAARLTAPAPPPALLDEPVRASRARWLPAAAAAAAVAAVVGLAAAVGTTGSGDGVQAAGPDATTVFRTSPVPIPDTLPAPLQAAFRALQADLPPNFRVEVSGNRQPADPADRTGRQYDIFAIVRAGSRSATVEVRYRTGLPPGDLCRISEKLAGAGSCHVVTTATGARVAVTRATGSSIGQWALYRHRDGSVVLVTDGSDLVGRTGPQLTGPVWSPERLAEVAADPAFRL